MTEKNDPLNSFLKWQANSGWQGASPATSTSTDPIAGFLAAQGLSAKLALIAAHREALLTEFAETEVAVQDRRLHFAPELQAALLKACREQGVEAGGPAFANTLVNIWLGQEELSRKAKLMYHWADPLLGDGVRIAVANATAQAEGTEAAPFFAQHLRLIDRCREQGIEAGLRAHADTYGMAKIEELAEEWQRILDQDTFAAIRRRIDILEHLLVLLRPSKEDGPLFYRSKLCHYLANDLSLSWRRGLIESDRVKSILDRSHELFDEAIRIRAQKCHAIEVAQPAVGQANLYWHQFEAGDFNAAASAHLLFDKALQIYRNFARRFERSDQWAMTAANQATLYGRQFEAGDSGAAAKAHALFDEAIDVFTECRNATGIAKTKSNQAGLFLVESRLGRRAAAAKAQTNFEDALRILRDHGDPVDYGLTLSAFADFLLYQFESGEYKVALRAHEYYDEVLDIFRGLNLPLEITRNTDHKASLYAAQYRTGDAGAAAKAHALYGEAEMTSRRLGRLSDVAKTLQNRAFLYAAQYDAGEADAAALAHALFEEALSLVRGLDWLKISRNRLSLLEAQANWAGIRASVPETLHVARRRIVELAVRADRDRLLTEIAGVGARGAAAALRLGDLSEALALLEEGRAQQLGARLREAEAGLSGNERAVLDEKRGAYQQAEAAAVRARERLSEAHAAVEGAKDADERAVWSQRRLAAQERLAAAEQALEAAHGALNALKTEFSLDDLTVPVPSPGELAEALGGAALVQAVAGRDGGWLLLLAPGAADWQAMPVAALTTAAVDKVTGRYQEAVGTFQAGKLPDGTQCPEGSLDPVNAFSQALDATLLPGDAEAPGIWDLIAGPIHWALQAAGMAPAAGAALAPEVVLCLPADLAMLPIHAARDPATGRPFHEDYASRLVPSLGALITAAARARRPVKPNVLTVTDPLDDLGIGAHPAAELFPADARTELAGYGGNPARPNIATWPGLAAAVEQSQPGFLAYFGHSHWDRRDGEGSGLVLAPELDAEGKIPGMKDLATPARIRGLALSSTRLVFSASCGGAGLSLVVAKDELGGLPSAWLEAGAAGMISSLYSVLTGPAEDIMKTTFAAMLGESLAPVQALRRAQMALARAFEPAPDPAPAEVPISNPFLDASRTSGPPVTARTPRRSNLHLNLHPTANIAAFVMFGA